MDGKGDEAAPTGMAGAYDAGWAEGVRDARENSTAYDSANPHTERTAGSYFLRASWRDGYYDGYEYEAAADARHNYKSAGTL